MNLPRTLAVLGAHALLTSLALAQATSTPPAASTTPPSEESVVTLSPFTVSESEDRGYRASSTLSGTRINTSLREIAASIQAITPEFLEDTGIARDTELLQYTTATEVAGGAGGNFYTNQTATTAFVSSDDNRRSETTTTRVRGLTSASTSRNLFPSLIPFDSYNLSRVEINRGANSVLFGLGSPAGIINYNISEAAWKNQNKVEIGGDNYGSFRTVADFNHVLLKDRLALRVIGLNDETKYKQDPAFRDDKRYYFTATWRPFRSTSITANFERGWIDSTLPRQDPPRDYITHFSTTGSRTVPINLDYRDLPAGSSVIQFDSGATGRLMTLDNPYGSTPGGAYFQWPDNVFNRGVINPAATNPARVNDFRFRQYAMQNGREFIAAAYGNPRGLDAYQLFLVDPTVYDFYNNNIDGTASYQWGRIRAFNAALRQEFLKGNAGFELGFDTQQYNSGYVDVLDGIRGNSLKIDISEGIFAYATPGNPASGLASNPNFLRPFVGSRGTFLDRNNENRTLRATAYLRHDFTERSRNWLTKLLGRQTLTAVAFDYEVERRNLSGAPAFMDYDDLRALGLPDAQARANTNTLGTVIYLGDSLAGRSTVTGLGLTGYKGTFKYPDSVELNYIDGAGQIRTGTVRVHHLQKEDPLRLATGASAARDELRTMAAVLQSHWWDGALVTTYGWRRDDVEQFTAPAYPQRVDFTRIYTEGRVRTTPDNAAERDTFTYSGVLRLNRLVGRWMPRGTEVDLHYGWSENYQGLSGVRSVDGGFFDAPAGETKEMGVSMTLLQDRLSFRANWFETTQENLTDNGVNESIDTITSMIPDSPSGGLYGLQTLAQLNAVGFQMPPGVIEAFGVQISPPDEAGYASYQRTITGRDTKTAVSKGFEFETTYNITKNWRLTANVAKVRARESNRGNNWADTVAWVKENWFNNPAIRALRVGAGGVLDTLGGWEQRAVTGFLNVQEADGASNPQIREWRANLVTNYTFPSASRFRGFGVGGGIRYQSEIFLGYQGKPNPADPSGSYISDVTKPIFGPTQTDYDMWLSYRRPIFNDRVNLKLQLNVRNVFRDEALIPVQAQQVDVYSQYPAFDHYKASGYQVYRIAPPRTIQLRATFNF